MSYEPTLVILKSDLELNRKKIEEAQCKLLCTPVSGKVNNSKRMYLERAYEELNYAMRKESVKIGGVEIVIIEPEGTTHNGNVRELLNDFNIEFQTDL